VVVVNPAQVRAFATALGKRAKTDPIDAAVIALSPRQPNRSLGNHLMR
jgi:transposase